MKDLKTGIFILVRQNYFMLRLYILLESEKHGKFFCLCRPTPFTVNGVGFFFVFKLGFFNTFLFCF